MKEFKKTFKTSTNWIFIFNLPVFLIIALFSKQILKILFGPNYISGYIPLLILIPSYFVYHLFTTSSRMLNILKKSKYLMTNITIAAIINIVLNYALIPRTDMFGGMVGGAIATSTSLIIYGLLCGIESYYLTKINPFQIKQIKTLFAGAVSISIAYYVFNMIQYRTFFNLGLVAILLISVYTTLILLLQCLTKYDYEILNSMKYRIKQLLKF